PDVLAYMNYFGQPYGEDFMGHCEQHRYDGVIVLPPWKEIYKTDHERLETFEEAQEIHACLEETYAAFKYNSIEVPTGSIEERTSYILNTIAKNL
ncbi:MAG: ATP-binding protein, partial [Muriicola sp.]|nr:ATP-binding protein [Muriicola sp.]